MTDPASCEIAVGALASPAWLPVRLAGGRVEGTRLDEADYRATSFLDARVLDGRARTAMDWVGLREAAPRPRPTHFIFHIGHCGSTLLARLLGEHPALFALREPALLRDLAEGRLAADDAGPLLGLYGRVWRDGQTALIKATSFVSEIAPDLMARAGGRALLLGVTPPAYLRGILAGPNARQEAAALAPSRRSRLERRLGRAVTATGTEGEAIALGWLCEASALDALATAQPDACLWLDFDAVLRRPAAGLETALSHLGADPAGLDVQALVAGPLMGRYAKGPEHAYDADLRRALLAQAEREAGPEVRAGMDWLQREARADPRVAAVLVAAAEAARAPLAPPPASV